MFFHKEVDLEKLNELMIEKKLTFVIKPHPSDTSEHINKNYSNIKLEAKTTDIYKLLPSAQILVTDYSSMIFDAMYMDIPIMLFCPDLDKYQHSNREFYKSIETLPIYLTKESSAFLSALKSASLKTKNKYYYPYKNKITRVKL